MAFNTLSKKPKSLLSTCHSDGFLEVMADVLKRHSSDLDDNFDTTFDSVFFEEIKPQLTSLINKIEVVYRYTPFIAGGCPRDLARGAEFSDVDIFIPIGENKPGERVDDIVHLFDKHFSEVIVHRKPTDIPSHYLIPHLEAVFTIEIEGALVQLVFLNVESIQETLDTFAVNISKCYMTPDFDIVLSRDAQRDFTEKTLTFSDKNGLSAKYRNKIMFKFPGYTLVDNE